MKDPERYGVVAFDKAGQAVSIEEKPARPRSNFAVTGLYFYDNSVLDIAANLKPSLAAERLEITDVNRGVPGQAARCTSNASAEASPGSTPARPNPCSRPRTSWRPWNTARAWKVACIEEVAYRMGFIDAEQPRRARREKLPNDYGQYLKNVIHDPYAVWGVTEARSTSSVDRTALAIKDDTVAKKAATPASSERASRNGRLERPEALFLKAMRNSWAYQGAASAPPSFARRWPSTGSLCSFTGRSAARSSSGRNAKVGATRSSKAWPPTFTIRSWK